MTGISTLIGGCMMLVTFVLSSNDFNSVKKIYPKNKVMTGQNNQTINLHKTTPSSSNKNTLKDSQKKSLAQKTNSTTSTGSSSKVVSKSKIETQVSQPSQSVPDSKIYNPTQVSYGSGYGFSSSGSSVGSQIPVSSGSINITLSSSTQISLSSSPSGTVVNFSNGTSASPASVSQLSTSSQSSGMGAVIQSTSTVIVGSSGGGSSANSTSSVVQNNSNTQPPVATTTVTTQTTPPSVLSVVVPVGIPRPEFNFELQAPARPSPWNNPVVGFYYIDETNPSATDSDNTYGTPLKPRKTIPGDSSSPLPAGSVVEVHGRYTKLHSSPEDFHGEGTKDKPIFIRGESSSSRPYFTKEFHIIGSSYVFVENIEFGDEDGDLSGGFSGGLGITDKNKKRYDSDHIVVRFCDFHSNLLRTGGGYVGGNGESQFKDIVFYKNIMHDNGNWKATFDQDVHGILVGFGSHNVWVLENIFYHNSGDGIQVSGVTVDNVSDIYIGKNIAYENKQHGFDIKKASRVVLSENTAYGHRPSRSSTGSGMMFHYRPLDVKFIKNILYDNTYGIHGDIKSSSSYYKENIHLTDNSIQSLLADYLIVD